MSASASLERLGERAESFPDALLLTGADDAELERCAMKLAARLLCRGDDPDLACDVCRRVFAGLHPDLLRVEPEGVGIRVDRVRDALAFGAGLPYEAARRVALVSRAELLGLEASNALLKSLEEPGKHLRWILTTTRPDSLLPTILSRCAAVPVVAPSRSQRRSLWRERGFSAEDAEDLALTDAPVEGAAEALETFRALRSEAVGALQAGLVGRRPLILLMLADRLARADPATGRLLAELLADAALAGSAPPEALRHRRVAGVTRELARNFSVEDLGRAAVLAADSPADTRRGNRRMHFEKVLLDLFLKGG